jgi:hypothetical protein
MIWECLFVGKVIYSTVKDLSGVSSRVYPLRIPQAIDLKTTNAISYYIISTKPEDTKDSRSLIDTVMVQVSIFSNVYNTANALAQLIREAMDGLSGEIAGTTVDSIRFTNEIDQYEDDVEVYHKIQEYDIRIKNEPSTNINAMTVVALSLTNDYAWADAIPAGYILEEMIFDETAGKTAQLSAGTSANGTNIFSQAGITEGALTVIKVDKAYSKTTAKTIYIHHSGDGDTWNGATITVYAILRKFYV